MSIITNPIELNEQQLELKNAILMEMTNDKVISRTNAELNEPPPNTNLTGFFKTVKELVDVTQENTDQRVLLTETMPEVNLFEDPDHPGKELSGYILTTVLKREPGTLAGGNQPFSSKRRDLKPKMLRGIIKSDPDKPGESTLIFSKWYDNLVGLNICCRTNKRANELADWLENLMETNAWYFQQAGFPLVFMDARLPDLRREDGLMKVSFRPFRFFVRTETFFTLTEHQLDRLIVQATAGT